MASVANLRRLAVAVVVVAGGFALVPPAQAAPGSDATVEAAEFTLLNRSAGSATATCPAGSRVVGGGVHTTGSTPAGNVNPYSVLASGPRDETGSPASADDGEVARSWHAYVFNGDNGTQLFKVFALCSRTSDAVVSATEVTAPVNFSSSAPATCPAGSRVVGGGLDTSTPERADGVAYSTRMSGPLDGETDATNDGDIANRWEATLVNASNESVQFKVIALCSRNSDATVEVTDFELASKMSASATATCPAGSRVMSGGVQARRLAAHNLMLSSPLNGDGSAAGTRTGDVARRWFGYARNQADARHFYKVIAVCTRDEVAGGGGGDDGGGGGPAPRCAGKRATIVGTSRGEVLRGTRRRDVIVALGGKDRVSAGGGNDIVCGGSGNDKLSGGKGKDRLFGQGGRDKLAGQGGRDKCSGGAGKDRATCERESGI